jgi:branched-chain amino acid transport system permease protein
MRRIVALTARPSVRWALAASAAVFLFLLPFIGVGRSSLRFIALTAILALVVSGLNLSYGFGGELALGQAAMYGAGGYAAAFVANEFTSELGAGIVAGIVIAAVLGLVTGLPALRLGGWQLAVTAFFIVLIFPDVINLLRPWTGGFDGRTLPVATLFGAQLQVPQMYLIAIAVALVWLVVFRNLVVAPFGIALLSMKHSSVLASSLGLSSYRLKLGAYVLGALPAGAAGALLANLNGFLDPSQFGFHLVVGLLVASVLGGRATVIGAPIGAMIFQFADSQATQLESYATIGFGLLLVVGGVFLTRGGGGVVGLAAAGIAWLRRVDDDLGAPDRAVTRDLLDVTGAPVTVRGVRKRFGGNQALDGVDFDARPGEITALIGPNGSGKTTLLNAISGFVTPDDGRISLGERDLAGANPSATARAGVARTFQTPAIPDLLTVRQVIEAGRLWVHPVGLVSTVLRLPSFRRHRRETDAQVQRLARLIGIEHLLGEQAGQLSVGTRRLVELARSVAGRPPVILLDEVASGLDESELKLLVDVLFWLRDSGMTVVLVEHNFSMVNQVSDRVYVMAEGRVLAEGTPAEIAAHPEVLQKYLGESIDTGDLP